MVPGHRCQPGWPRGFRGPGGCRGPPGRAGSDVPVGPAAVRGACLGIAMLVAAGHVGQGNHARRGMTGRGGGGRRMPGETGGSSASWPSWFLVALPVALANPAARPPNERRLAEAVDTGVATSAWWPSRVCPAQRHRRPAVRAIARSSPGSEATFFALLDGVPGRPGGLHHDHRPGRKAPLAQRAVVDLGVVRGGQPGPRCGTTVMSVLINAHAGREIRARSPIAAGYIVAGRPSGEEMPPRSAQAR